LGQNKIYRRYLRHTVLETQRWHLSEARSPVVLIAVPDIAGAVHKRLVISAAFFLDSSNRRSYHFMYRDITTRDERLIELTPVILRSGLDQTDKTKKQGKTK
jgi:hypothetical protein